MMLDILVFILILRENNLGTKLYIYNDYIVPII